LLTQNPWRRWPLVVLCASALFVLYFFGLSRTGLLGPDEPRYAAIGRAMAESGDWITPRLWGQPWFEKPALLYWMTATGFKLGLNRDLAPRLPVAVASVAFLVYFFWVLRREFGDRAAFYSAGILATSAGWLAYSHVAVPDLLIAASFAAAMLLLMRGPELSVGASLAAGILLGIAILAKGLVPLALLVPALWFLRRQVRDLSIVLALAAVISTPWYILVTLRNGQPFLDVFFGQQQFARFFSGESLHPRPVWFYLPVLIAGLFPWSPLALLLLSKRLYQDRRAKFLLAWFAFGFVFFSLSRGKLPGYLLPLLPAAAALMGIALSQTRERTAFAASLLAICAGLPWLVPSIQDLLPQALVSGLTRSHFHFAAAWLIPALVAIPACVWLERSGRRPAAFLLGTLIITSAVFEFVWRGYPLLDREASARSRWLSNAGSITCVSKESAPLRFGLDYYAGRSLPDCN
jgi:4-amino-4-deoxy-L-arabinose transferase